MKAWGQARLPSSGSRGHTENQRQGPEQARAGWLRAEVGDRSGREAPLEHPCKGTSVCRQQPLSLRLACQCQEYESPQAQPFHFDLHHCQDHNKKSGRIYARTSSIFIKIFFAHNVPNLFLCSWYLELHNF